MDTLERYRQIVQEVLQPYTLRKYSGLDVTNEALFDEKNDHYAILSVGWEGRVRRIHHPLLHLDIINGKVWIQRDGTEYGIADELEEAGIPKKDIVLAFHRAEDRALLPEYAVY